jgi:hypothetical protein
VRRQKRFRRSEHSSLGTLQNPEAHKNGISKEDFDALRRIGRDHRNPKETLETLKDWARALEASPPRSPEPSPEAAPELARESAAPSAETSSAPLVPDSTAIAAAPIRRPRRCRPVRPRKRATEAMARHGISAEVPALDRHARKCAVCKHKEREFIEADFLHWHNSVDIICDFDLPNTRVLFRHAHATGLYEKRMLNMRYAAALIVDWADTVKPSATAVLKAMRACTLLSDRGEWIDPPNRVVHYVGVGDPSMFRAPANPNLEPNRPQLSAATLPEESPEQSENEAEDDEISNRRDAIRNRPN